MALVMLVLYFYDAYCAGESGRFLIYDPWASRFTEPVGRVREIVEQLSFFVALVLLARSFSDYLRPRSASHLMALPVSTIERFGFVVLFYFLVVPLVLFVTRFVIDLGFMLYYDQGSLWGSIFGRNWPLRQVLRPLFDFSIFLWGAIFFRRYNFVATCLVYFGVAVVLFGVMTGIGAAFGEQLQGFASFLESHAIEIFMPLMLIFSGGMIFWAYRLFRNFQITK